MSKILKYPKMTNNDEQPTNNQKNNDKDDLKLFATSCTTGLDISASQWTMCDQYAWT